jgi:putative membrane protein
MPVAARLQFVAVLAVLVWSGVAPFARDVWLLETFPAVLGLGVMVLLWRRFPWTPLAVTLSCAFGVVLCVGGHYTYAHVPLGEWARTAFDLSRNHYDRLGHVMQGVIPAVLARELLLRSTGLRQGKALFWVCVSIALAISAVYEILEWWTAVLAAPEAGIAFLGSQGDVWDAQWDMFLALGGALVVQLALGRLHDRQLAALHR